MALATLVVDLILKAGGFETDMNRASKTAKARLKEIHAEAEKVGKAIGVALAAGVVGIGVAIKGAIDRADELNKVAGTLGLTTEALSRLSYAAKLSDVDLETLSGAFAKMTKVQAEAVTKGSAAATVFEAFGIKAIDPLTGKLRDNEAVFRDWVGVLSKLDAPERMAVGMEVFGKSFADLVPLISGGTEALDAFGAESDRIGNTVSTGVAQQADEFNDRLDTLKSTLGGVAMQVAADLLPQLIRLEEELQQTAESGEAARNIAEVFHVVEIAARLVVGAVQAVADTVQAMASTIISNFHLVRSAYRLFHADLQGADADFQKFREEREAALYAYNETKNFDWTGSGGGAAKPEPVQWIDAPTVGEHQATQRAKKQAQEYLDAQNRRAKESEARAAAAKAAAAAARAQAQAQRELDEQQKKSADASAEFTVRLQDMADELAGPAAQALTKYKRDQAELNELASIGKVKAEDLTRAQTLLSEAYKVAAKEAEAKLHPEREALEQLQSYLAVANATNEAERDRIELMRQFPNASKKMVDQLVESKEALRDVGEAINVADGIRSHFEDAFSDILSGTKSVKDAFKDLAASILSDIARMLAKKWVEQLFGQTGTTGAGSAGGGFLSWLTSFFTGSANGNAFDRGEVTPFAAGGVVSRPTIFPMARGMGLMGEAGPEAVMPLSRMANGKLGVHAGGRSTVINVNVDGQTTRETAQQVANKVAQALRFAERG